MSEKKKEVKITTEDMVRKAEQLKTQYHIKTIASDALTTEEVWIWKDGYYHRNGEGVINTEVLNSVESKCSDDGEKKIQYQDHHYRQILSYIKANTRVEREEVKQTPNTANFLNGVFDYSTGIATFIPRASENTQEGQDKKFWNHNFTYIIPVNYNIDAKCQSIDTILEQILVRKDVTTENLIKRSPEDEWVARMLEERDRMYAPQTTVPDATTPTPDSSMMFPVSLEKPKDEAEEYNVDEKIRKLYILEEFLGSLLMSEYEIKKALVFVGRNDTGKSTVLNIIQQFIGEHNIARIPLKDLDTTQNRFAGAELLGKLANIVDEMPTITMKSVDTFKNAVGGGAFTVEKKRKDPIPLKNNAKMLFAANELPDIPSNIKQSFYNRIVIVEFENEFTPNDRQTDRKRKDYRYTPEELSGLLNHAINGLNRLLKVGKYSYNDEETPTLWEKYPTMINPLDSFMQDWIEITKRESDAVPKNLFYDWYVGWCNSNNIPNIDRVTKNKFGRAVSQIDGIKSATKYDSEKSKEAGQNRSTQFWTGVRRRESYVLPQ